MKSLQSDFRKKSHVSQAMTLSVSHHFFKAKIGFQAAITSIGTIQKSSSQGKMSPSDFCTRETRSSQY